MTGQIGALNAESFAERVNSGAKMILTTLNSNLSDEDIEKFVVLLMNRNFMSYMRKHHFNEMKALQPFNITVIYFESKLFPAFCRWSSACFASPGASDSPS